MVLQRIVFYPTLAYNVLLAKYWGRPWYHRIDETVLLGALPFRSITQDLLAENVRVVITMTEPFETKFWVNTAEQWNSYGIKQIHLSTPDFIAAPTQADIKTGVQCIEEQRQRGTSVYVHCKAGRTRSATLVACYLMKRHTWSPQQAVEFIKGKRPHITIRKKQWMALQEYYCSSVAQVEN